MLHLTTIIYPIGRTENMNTKLFSMANHCRNRGGDCPCRGPCQSLSAIDDELGQLAVEQAELQRQQNQLEDLKRRLQTPPATLRDGFVFRSELQPVMVFDGDVAVFGYEDAVGEWTETDDWPFSETFVWQDDCERHGIRVEVA